jgi:hypothetical protein
MKIIFLIAFCLFSVIVSLVILVNLPSNTLTNARHAQVNTGYTLYGKEPPSKWCIETCKFDGGVDLYFPNGHPGLFSTVCVDGMFFTGETSCEHHGGVKSRSEPNPIQEECFCLGGGFMSRPR